jgi:hypothetical protein
MHLVRAICPRPRFSPRAKRSRRGVSAAPGCGGRGAPRQKAKGLWPAAEPPAARAALRPRGMRLCSGFSGSPPCVRRLCVARLQQFVHVRKFFLQMLRFFVASVISANLQQPKRPSQMSLRSASSGLAVVIFALAALANEFSPLLLLWPRPSHLERVSCRGNASGMELLGGGRSFWWSRKPDP